MFFLADTFINKIFARLTGPMNFRFIFQPLAAILYGIKDGKMDAKAGEPPFIFDFIRNPHKRERNIKRALKRLLIPIIVGILLDGIAQHLIFKNVNIIGAVLMGTFIMGLPYSLARGISNRIFTKKMTNQKEKEQGEDDKEDGN